jgi:hypothetical protein
MSEEPFAHTPSNRAGRIADAVHRLPQSTEEAIYRLLKASTFAEDTDRDAWDFAVTIGELRRDGVSENELRWLVCRGYVKHATEIVTKTGNVRTFDHDVSLRFCKETAFIITEAGVAFSRQFRNELVPKDVDPGVNGNAKLVDDGSLAAKPQFADLSPPKSNGSVIPKWDRDRRELRVGGELVKVFKLPSPLQEAILMAFEEEHWPPRIDDPLPTNPELLPKRRLHDAIKSLNRNQKRSLIRFMGDGTGEGVRWELHAAEEISASANRLLR